MKRTAAVILLFTLVFSASVTSFGQKSRSARAPLPVTDFAQFDTIQTFSDGQGVLVRWRMASETRNIGFYLYRNAAEGQQQVNPNVIGGYATKSNAPTGYGGTYEFYDPNGGLDTIYSIQSLSAEGRRVSTAPIGVKFTDNFERDTGHPKEYYEQHALNTNGDIESRGSKLPKDLENVHGASLLPPDPNGQRYVAAQPGAKIGVRTEGMYRVTRTELQNAGFNVNSNSANWRLFMEGNEQAIIVGPSDQYIEFYGRSLDTVESDTRMYYLIADSTPGKRISTRVVRNIGGGAYTNNYSASAVRKERFLYINSVINGSAENYWGSLLSDSPTPVPNPSPPPPQVYTPFVLDNIDTSAPTATITLRIQGFIGANHEVHATINGAELGYITCAGQASGSATFTVPTSALIEGPNFFQFTATHSGDFTLFDSATINYARHYVSANNRLGFYTPGYRKADVTNFSSANVRVFDTTYDANTQLLVNFPIVNAGGTFTAKLPSDRAAVMYAVEDSGLLQSPSITFNNPSTLATPNNSADMLIISYSASDFMAVAETWANYRRSTAGGSFNVKVVDVADIYDEFNYGVANSDSITSFLQYAKTNWQGIGPRYVLLLGDGSYDPRNYEGYGNWNLIPAKFANLVFAESPSDDALADYDHDGVANLPIGRVPARTSFDIGTVFNKTMTFETPANWDLQTRGALFGFDLPIGFDFEAMSMALRNDMPDGTRIVWVPRGLPPPHQNEVDPNAHANLITGLNSGPYVVNYAGHGSTGIWASSGYFSNNDVPNLVNSSNPSIYVMLTCLNGYFVNPSVDSIAEALVKSPNGGAVAAWGSTADTTPDLQMLMGDRFYHQLAIGQIKRMGDLVMDAKSVIPPGSDVGFSWTLLSDPALKVHP